MCLFFNTHNLFLGVYYSIIWLVNYSHVTSINGDLRRNEKIQIVDQNTSQNQTLLTKHVSKTNEGNACWHVNYLWMSWHKAKTWKRRVIIRCVGSRGWANQRLKLINIDIWICNCAETCIMFTRLCVVYLLYRYIINPRIWFGKANATRTGLMHDSSILRDCLHYMNIPTERFGCKIKSSRTFNMYIIIFNVDNPKRLVFL